MQPPHVLGPQLGKLPAEVWERVIDLIAKDFALARELPKCSLVCRSWLPRCRHHFVLRVILRSVDDLTSFDTFVRASPHQLTKPVKLVLRPGNYGAWITAVPRTLPILPTLEEARFQNVDLDQQHASFYQSCSLLRPRRLEIDACQFKDWSQLTRLVSYVQPQELHVTIDTYSVGGSFELRSHTLRKIVLRASLNVLIRLCSKWRYSAPRLETIELWYNRWSEKGSSGEYSNWRGIVRLFEESRHRLPALSQARLGLGSVPEVTLLRDVDTQLRTVELQHIEMRSNRLRMQILSLSRFNPHHIRIKMDMVPRPESGLFSVVDKLLANAEKTPALQTVSLRFSGSAHKELRRDGPCVVELLTGLFSACVERGVCGRVCDPDICPLHGHLRQWESVVTTTHTPQACQDEKVEELLRHGGVPPSLRPRVWAYLTHSASKRIDGLYADMEKQTSRLLLSDTNRDVANFARRHTELSSSMLTKILKAFLAFSKAPYTPNLVSIAGLILLQTPNPEDAFWTFTSLMTTHLSAFQSRIEEHATLVAKHLETKDPELATKLFIDLAILPVSLFRPWFANVFVGTLPDEHLLHVWDWLLYQGPEFLLRTAVAILTLDDVKTALLEADSQAAAMTIVLDLPASLLPKEAEVFVGKVFTVKW